MSFRTGIFPILESSCKATALYERWFSYKIEEMIISIDLSLFIKSIILCVYYSKCLYSLKQKVKKYKLLVLHKMRKKNQVHAKRDIIWWLWLTRICDKLFEDAGPPTSSARSENTQHREERIHRRGRDRVLRLVRAKRTSCRRTSDTS